MLRFTRRRQNDEERRQAALLTWQSARPFRFVRRALHGGLAGEGRVRGRHRGAYATRALGWELEVGAVDRGAWAPRGCAIAAADGGRRARSGARRAHAACDGAPRTARFAELDARGAVDVLGPSGQDGSAPRELVVTSPIRGRRFPPPGGRERTTKGQNRGEDPTRALGSLAPKPRGLVVYAGDRLRSSRRGPREGLCLRTDQPICCAKQPVNSALPCTSANRRLRIIDSGTHHGGGRSLRPKSISGKNCSSLQYI
jgi:hypothetical protein